MTFRTKLLSAVSAAALSCLAATGASAVTTTPVSWNGPSNFNDAFINFAGINAFSYTISGVGTYEGGDNGNTLTNFTVQLEWGGTWHTVDTFQLHNKDHVPSFMNGRGTINFATNVITGIQLLSAPDGVPAGDFNYKNFLPTITFEFNGPDAAPTPTPLPAALPLMATVLGGAGLAAWRRRRKAAAE